MHTKRKKIKSYLLGDQVSALSDKIGKLFNFFKILTFKSQKNVFLKKVAPKYLREGATNEGNGLTEK